MQILIQLSLSLVGGLLLSRLAKKLNLPAVTALPMLLSCSRRNSLPMVKAIKPRATWEPRRYPHGGAPVQGGRPLDPAVAVGGSH